MNSKLIQSWSELSLKYLLQKHLQTLLNQKNQQIPLKSIPLQLLKDRWRTGYISAIALKLSRPQALDLATEIAQQCQTIQFFSGETQADFLIEVVPPAFIIFELTDAGLAHWLHHLTQTPLSQVPRPLSAKNTPPVGNLFPIQYSHARCCSLLRLAHRDQLICLTEPELDAAPTLWQFTTPNPIPWRTPAGKFQLVHPAERHLISQLLLTLDTLAAYGQQVEHKRAGDKPTNWLALAHQLSESFQQFYRHCRIWGEVKTETPELAQARLGLLVATQSLLRFLLENILETIAPLEL